MFVAVVVGAGEGVGGDAGGRAGMAAEEGKDILGRDTAVGTGLGDGEGMIVGRGTAGKEEVG